MSVSFSEHPGRHERHYRRRLGNPLFPDSPSAPDDELLFETQRMDHEELMAFLVELRQAVQRAIELKPNEGSEVILDIKEHLDRLYEMSAGLAEKHADNQAAIRQLLDVIMRNVERGAAGDPQAIDELAQESAARETHFELLKTPLVADLLHPQTCIAADELAPTLLSADEPDLAAALQLFDLEQLSALHADAGALLAACPNAPRAAHERLAQIGVQLARLKQSAPLN